MVTIAWAMWSWLRTMKVAMAMISNGATVATSLPVGVSPMVLATKLAMAPAIAPATTKMITAAMTLGRYASTWFMNAVTAGIFSAPIAAESTNRKISQKPT